MSIDTFHTIWSRELLSSIRNNNHQGFYWHRYEKAI